MKILVEGQLPIHIPQLFRGTCNNCGCQIEVDASETHEGFGRICSTGGKDNRYIKCPTQNCEFEILVEPYITR
jgi:hypothetical protein